MTFEGEKPLDASCGHSPGMVALVPRRAHRALRYLHHAGIRLVLSKFGRMPRVRASGGFTAPEETQERTLQHQQLLSRVPSHSKVAWGPRDKVAWGPRCKHGLLLLGSTNIPFYLLSPITSDRTGVLPSQGAFI